MGKNEWPGFLPTLPAMVGGPQPWQTERRSMRPSDTANLECEQTLRSRTNCAQTARYMCTYMHAQTLA